MSSWLLLLFDARADLLDEVRDIGKGKILKLERRKARAELLDRLLTIKQLQEACEWIG